MTLSRYGVFLGVALLSAATVVAAEAPGPVSPQRPEPAGPSPMTRDFPPPPLPGARVDAEIAYIQTALKLTERQLPEWLPVADALRGQAKRMDVEITAHMKARQAKPDPADPLERLQDHQKALAAQAEDLAKLIVVLKPLYAVLTPDQKDDAARLLTLAAMPGIPGMPGVPMAAHPPFPPPQPHELP